MLTLQQAVAAKFGDDLSHQLRLLQRRLHYTGRDHVRIPDPALSNHPREYIDEFHRINHLRFTGD